MLQVALTSLFWKSQKAITPYMQVELEKGKGGEKAMTIITLQQ